MSNVEMYQDAWSAELYHYQQTTGGGRDVPLWLELAERIRLDRAVLPLAGPVRQTPAIARRGIKFNIPLDLRTPGYSDCSLAGRRSSTLSCSDSRPRKELRVR